MNFWFTIREGFKGFSRARLSTFISISSIVFSLFLISVFLIVSLNIDSWISQLRSKLELEVFIDRTKSDNEIQLIQQKINKINGLAEINYISKEDAAKRFEKEFGQNIYSILNSNPLPASFVLKLKKEHQNAQSAQIITSEISKIDGVEEVIYQKELISVIDNYIEILYLGGILIIVLLITITFILLYNTIRLTIYARRDIIEIMKLVGAKKSFIKRPFVIEGILQGVLGAGFACVAVYFAVKLIIRFVYPYLILKSEIFAILFVLGFLIGYLSSWMSVRKHLQTY
ncbi:MAG: ABC transporter permease [Calditrichae bacterium]|nr:ABC transporter permease [Calditrichota bacterium]MCB9057635.1 ABC transporter permease [Calditrichia bacterium]